MSKYYEVTIESTVVTNYYVDVDLYDKSLVDSFYSDDDDTLYVDTVNGTSLRFKPDMAIQHRAVGDSFIECLELDDRYTDSVTDSNLCHIACEVYEYYENFQQDKSLSIIMVKGGGIGNGNGYANVENRDGKFYYCEYGANPIEKYLGNKIIYDEPNNRFKFRIAEE